MSKEIDHEYTQEIVCPYCGAEWTDSWEEGSHPGDEDIGELECFECERKFYATRNIDITYCTEKIGKCEKCGADSVKLDETPLLTENYLVCTKCWREDYKIFKDCKEVKRYE